MHTRFSSPVSQPPHPRPVPQHQFRHRPDQRIDAVGRVPFAEPVARRTRTSHPPARSAPARGGPGPARRARRPVRRAPICRASRAPCAPARRASTWASTALTMSPPWLVSATMQSASKSSNAAHGATAPSQRRRRLQRQIGEHGNARRRARPATTMPQPSDCALLVAGGSTATTMRPSGVAVARAEHVARPQRARQILDQFAVELLPPEHRAAIARHHGAQKARRQMPAVLVGRHARRHGRADRRSAASAVSSAAAWSSPFAAAVSPSRNPNCSMSQAASACGHLPISSHQAAANCGPRKRSGSAAPSTMPSTPLGQRSVAAANASGARRAASPRSSPLGALDHHRDRLGDGLADQRDRPDAVAPPVAAPIRPRPVSCPSRGRPAAARSTQSPGGGSWLGRAHSGQS